MPDWDRNGIVDYWDYSNVLQGRSLCFDFPYITCLAHPPDPYCEEEVDMDLNGESGNLGDYLTFKHYIHDPGAPLNSCAGLPSASNR